MELQGEGCFRKCRHMDGHQIQDTPQRAETHTEDEPINPDHRSRPTADIDSIRVVLATIAGTPAASFSNSTADVIFINSKWDPTAPRIYMHAPQMLRLPSGQMLLLDTCIYGLVEAEY